MAVVVAYTMSGHFTEPLLTSKLFFCKADAFHTKIRNDCSWQVCVHVGAPITLNITFCYAVGCAGLFPTAKPLALLEGPKHIRMYGDLSGSNVLHRVRNGL